MATLKSKENRIDAVLFDLDGTLLRVQMTEFIPRYVAFLAENCREHVKPKVFKRVMLGSIRSLIQEADDGVLTNEQRIYGRLTRELGISRAILRGCFERFAANQLDTLRDLVRPIPLARKILQECAQRGTTLVLATNPVFPDFMIQARLRWGNLADIPFHHLTSFENSRYCKPQSGYFQEIVDYLGLRPERCLMVGNDTLQDLAAAAIGMQTFLVDTWIIEREGSCWPCHHRGDHAELQRFLHEHLTGEYF